MSDVHVSPQFYKKFKIIRVGYIRGIVIPADVAKKAKDKGILRKLFETVFMIRRAKRRNDCEDAFIDTEQGDECENDKLNFF